MVITDTFTISVSVSSESDRHLVRAFLAAVSEGRVSLRITGLDSTEEPRPKDEHVPAQAPELYTNRSKGRSESAPNFIRRVYGRWLTGEFTRYDLRRLDPACEQGLRNYEKGHGHIPLTDLNLPTLKGRREIQRHGWAATDSQTAGPTIPLEPWRGVWKGEESVVQFIRRVYGPRLDGKFTMADLQEHDPKLHRAFYNALRVDPKNPELLDLRRRLPLRRPRKNAPPVEDTGPPAP